MAVGVKEKTKNKTEKNKKQSYPREIKRQSFESLLW